MNRHIELIDTTLRDGQQSPLLFDSGKYKFSLREKKLIVEGLIKLGVKYIEMFSPVVGEAEKSEFQAIKEHAKNLDTNVMLICHCRCNDEDIKQALVAGFDGLNLFFGTSDHAINHGHGKSLEFIKETATSIIKNLRESRPDFYIRFSGEDAFRTKLETLFYIYDDLAPYCNTFGTPDTVGTATPQLVAERIKALKERYPNVKLECHFHNDRGLAIINTLTAIENGVDYVDTAIWGLAERSGITSTTAILLNLFYTDAELINGYNIENAYPLNVLMGSILNTQVPYTEPVSLTNRTHIAGVHAKSVLNAKKVYEEIDLTKFGVTTNQILLGPLSGWNLIAYYLREVQNFELDDNTAKEITKIFKSKTDLIDQYNTPENQLIEIANEFHLNKKLIPSEFEARRLENLKSQTLINGQ